jgi:tetratricopeptide (TPR) repeat protein
MTDASDRLKPALADRYTIERELGSGGMATVYLAQDLKHERQVAIKVLRQELAAALGAERFHQEIKIAANLHHPHILPLYDSGEADGFLYYVMPYEEGQSLRDKLAKEGELPVPEAVRILRDVVDALSHAHKHNVVHRDIKPDNVMLSERHALVTDFGVAKAVSEATGAQKLTTEGVALGTPAYMAPEQAAADPHIDHRADIYAVGVIAYELLTGRTPFVGNTQQELLAAHVTQTPDPVTKYRESVPPSLAELVMKCLEKKAADRWQTAEELLPQLEALATPSGGVTPTGTSPINRVAKHRWMMAGGTVGVAIVVAVIAVLAAIPRGSGVRLDPNHVVVAEFRNETGDPSLDQFGSRVGHWITQGLQAAAIPVTPWDLALEAWEYVESEAEERRVRDRIIALAEETGAGIVISGALYRVGTDSIEVQVSMVDALNGGLLGSVGPVRGIGTSESEIIANVQQQVMAFAALRFDESLSDWADAVGEPPTYDAYQAFSEGQSRQWSGEYEEAEREYRRASQLAPTWAQPRIRLVVVLSNRQRPFEADSVLRVLEGFGERLTPYERAAVMARRARLQGDRVAYYRYVRRAGALAPRSPDEFNVAVGAWRLRNRPAEAVEVLEAIDPERGWAREWFGYWEVMVGSLRNLGMHREALEVITRGCQLHPDRTRSCLGLRARELAALGDVDEVKRVLDILEAEPDVQSNPSGLVRPVEVLHIDGLDDVERDVLESVLEWFANRPLGEASSMDYRFWYGKALYLDGRNDDAFSVVDALVDDFPDDVRSRGFRGFICASSGDSAQALEDARWLEDYEWLGAFGDQTSYWRTVIAGALGDRERVAELLRDADTWWDWANASFSIELDPLRDYPEFQELMRPKG